MKLSDKIMELWCWSGTGLRTPRTAMLGVLLGLAMISASIESIGRSKGDALPVDSTSTLTTITVTPYDIYSLVTGPQTSEVIMEGYTETRSYHQTYYVSVSAGSDENGDGSRSRPWASIRYALGQIEDNRLSNRQAILVAGGEYTEGSFEMKEYVHLYGGFDPESWQRDIRVHQTVLDGRGRDRIMVCANHAKADGFVFLNGMVRGNGGAILCDGTSPLLSNNVFRKNKSLQPEDWNPEFLHEIAHDGGAVAAINGAAPRILNNLFVENETECGRGAGVAAHNRAAPIIAYNVFVNNVAGTDDPMRSSDGGAISSAYFSHSDIFYNIIAGNRAESTNDGGGIFSELWSSVHIAGNLILDNYTDDDGGGIYLSGQMHHYITEPDPVPPKERYLSRLTGNLLVGNTNSVGGHDSGFRFTNDTRVIFDRNITYANFGGLDFRRTMVTGRDNLFLDIVTVREPVETARFYNSLFFRELRAASDTKLIDSKKIELDALPESEGFEKIFRTDGMVFRAITSRFDTERYVTDLIPEQENVLPPGSLNNRVIRVGDRWSAVKSTKGSVITVWGDHEGAHSAELLPTFSIHPQSAHYGQVMRVNGPQITMD